MRRTQHGLGQLAMVAAAMMAASCAGDVNSADTGGQSSSGQSSGDDRIASIFANLPKYASKEVCAHNTAPGVAHCYARVRTDAQGKAVAAATPTGFGPSDLVSAYKLPSSGGSGQTIVIVDAQDDPTAEADLGVYRSQYGLPACTTANGCFKKVNQTGAASPLPSADSGWATEIALDIEMASAACPSCKIVLVEANSANNSDLYTAEDTAAGLGTVVSNSWGGAEDNTIAASEKYFNHPGVAVFVAAGDSGYGAEYPATSAYVTAVGGTSLATASGGRGWVETVWGSASNSDGGTASGCSAYVAKPSWQKDTGCKMRTMNDVAAVADPNTGVAVYDSTGSGGWTVVGGTSVASPLTASIFALTGHNAATPQFSYSNLADFYDVTTGTDGSCGGTYLCTAETGYDGPTGNGTPNGSLLGGGTCTPNCSGKSCGSDGCGGTCGTCPTGDSCSASGQCVAGCTPQCSGKSCGSDGCGGTCGTCPTGETCSATGTCQGTGSQCAHSECSAGKKLKDGCDSCVSSVCSYDSYCCATKWDDICVSEADSDPNCSC